MSGCVSISNSAVSAFGSAYAAAFSTLQTYSGIHDRFSQLRDAYYFTDATIFDTSITLVLGVVDGTTPQAIANAVNDLESATNTLDSNIANCTNNPIDGFKCYDADNIFYDLRLIREALGWFGSVLAQSSLYEDLFGCIAVQLDLDIPLLPNFALVRKSCLEEKLIIERQYNENIARLIEAQGIFEGSIRCENEEPDEPIEPPPPPPPPPPLPPPLSEECCDALTIAINNLNNLTVNVNFEPVFNALIELEGKLTTTIEGSGELVLDALSNLELDVDLNPVFNAILDLKADLQIEFNAILTAIAELNVLIVGIVAALALIKADLDATLQLALNLDANLTLALELLAQLDIDVAANLTAILELKAELILKLDNLLTLINEIKLQLGNIELKINNVIGDIGNISVDVDVDLTGIENLIVELSGSIDLLKDNILNIENNIDIVKDDIDKIEREVKDIEDCVCINISGTHQMEVCDPREDIYVAGSINNNKETRNYIWAGEGVLGLTKQVESLQEQLNDVGDILCKLSEVTPIFHVTDPNEKYQEFRRTAEMRITYVRYGVGLKRASNDSTWHIVIPNPRENLTWDDISTLIYPKGTYPGRLNIIDSKQGIYGNFNSEASAISFLNSAKNLSTANFNTTPRITLSGSDIKRTVKTENLYPISATIAFYDDNSNITAVSCLRPN